MEAPEQKMAAPDVSQASACVLLVEDNEDVREVLRETLIMDGYHVEVAVDGAAAVQAAITLNPQLAVIDIGLPDMDGYEVARRMRKALGTSIVLVALTGYNTPEDRQEAYQAGFDAHLVKPADPGALERILAAAGVRKIG
ncbi:MAG TPA: response regulator [Polyangia bacterium]|nr:response regulator [Polyangia bacterium]